MLSLRKFTKGLCGVLLAIWLGAPLAPAQEQQDNFLIIRAFSGPTLINSGLEAFYQNDRLLIPVTYFVDDLDVPLTYDEEQNRLTGWVGEEGNTAEVDFKKMTGRVGKEMFDFTPDDFLLYEGDLFLSTDLVDKILTTHSEFDFAGQSLRVYTSGNLPFEKELSRRQKQQHFDYVQKEKQAARERELNKEVYMQKNWLQAPFLDLSARYSISKSKGQPSRDNLGYSANATFLTGGFDSEFNAFASSSDDKPSLTFKTAREDEKGNILGLFKHLEMGDTYAYSNAENPSSTAGVGIKMSTESSLSADNKTYTFRDALPLGWEVELYRNGELMAYQSQSNDGYFEFNDIPLLLGKNNFKLVFYGPQGQTKEREQVVFFNGNMLNRGKGRLRLNYINKNRFLIETHDPARETSRGHNAYIEAGYGLTDKLTLNVGAIADSLELFMEYPPDSMYRKDKEYGLASLSLFTYGIYSSLGTVFDFERGAATLDYYTQTSLLGWDTVFQNTYYGNAITSDNLFYNTYIKNDTNVRLNKTLDLWNWSVPVSYNFRHFSVVRTDKTQTEHMLSVSQSLPYNIYINAQYQNIDYFNSQRVEQLGLAANHVRGAWTIRSNTTYDFVHDRFSRVEASVYRSLTKRLKAGAHYAYQSRDVSTHSYESLYSGNLSWLTKYGYISLEVGTSNWHNSYAFVGYNMSFLPDMRNGRVYASGSKLQGTGALSAFAFMDENGDGTYEKGEEILKEAQFALRPKLNVYDSEKKTSKGSTVLTHLTAYRDFEVDTDISQVEDTLSLLNASGTRTVKLRPAQVAYLAFPIVVTGDIEGTVYMENEDGEQEPKKGIIVNLYKGEELVGNKISEYDGYYSFPQTPLGNYTVRLDRDQAEDLELHQTQKIEINLTEPEQLEVRDIVLAPGVEEPEEETQQAPAPKKTLRLIVPNEEEGHYNVPVPLTEVEGELPTWLETTPDLVPLLAARVVDPVQQEAWPHTQEKTVAQLLSEQTAGQNLKR